MTPAERVHIAARMYENAISLARSSILCRSPGIFSDELEYDVRRRVLPRELAEQPGAQDPPPDMPQTCAPGLADACQKERNTLSCFIR
jgi:hypothetical protein